MFGGSAFRLRRLGDEPFAASKEPFVEVFVPVITPAVDPQLRSK
jgi:hypothetical protein